MTSYQRTQVYLDPEQHRKLLAEATARGESLAALVRGIVQAHLDGRSAAAEPKTFKAITAIVELDEPADLVGNWDQTMSDAVETRYRKKVGTTRRKPAAKRPRRARG